ncbi:MAG: hypothetical protein K6U87_14070 [Firmicutes bacterium]|nr:hypothetical protein [Bacillota bacterium]
MAQAWQAEPGPGGWHWWTAERAWGGAAAAMDPALATQRWAQGALRLCGERPPLRRAAPAAAKGGERAP